MKNNSFSMGMLIMIMVCLFSYAPKAHAAVSGEDIANRAVTYVHAKGTKQEEDRKRTRYSQEKRDINGYGDCSTFVQSVYADLGIKGIGSYTVEQLMNKKGTYISSPTFLKEGDLVFFKAPNTSSGHAVTLPNGVQTRVSHVGIYIGNLRFVDLSSSKGTISTRHFSEPNISGRFIGGKRFIH